MPKVVREELHGDGADSETRGQGEELAGGEALGGHARGPACLIEEMIPMLKDAAGRERCHAGSDPLKER